MHVSEIGTRAIARRANQPQLWAPGPIWPWQRGFPIALNRDSLPQTLLLALLADFLFGQRDPGGGTTFRVAQVAELLALGVEEHDRRITLDAELLGQILILLLQFWALLLLAREVDLKQDDVLVGPLFELGLAEDLVLELDAPAAPVGAGEVGEDDLLLLLGLRQRVLVVDDPAIL